MLVYLAEFVSDKLLSISPRDSLIPEISVPTSTIAAEAALGVVIFCSVCVHPKKSILTKSTKTITRTVAFTNHHLILKL